MTQHGHHHHGPSQAHGFVYAGIYLFKEGGGGEGFREGRWQSRLVSLGEGDADPASTSCWSARGVLNITRPLSGPMCVCVCVSTGLALPLPGVATQPASLLSQPLFKRFTQTRWATPQQTLEEIISAVAERMPEFSELQDCFREVRGAGLPVGDARTDVCVRTPGCAFLFWHPPLLGPWPSGMCWVPMALPTRPPRSCWRWSTCTW